MKGYITEYLSTLIRQPMVYGENDCHIMALTVIDLILGTNYKDEIYQKYTNTRTGRKYAKDNCSYPTLKDLCIDKGRLVTTPQDGDVLLCGSHSTVYWRGKVILIDEENIYQIRYYEPDTYKYKIYRFMEE